MRIFVTGATGFIGSAVVQELLQAGHQVIGLTRSEAGAETLRGLGVQVQRGDLDDPESLAAGARASEGVIHTAFNHDFSNMAGAAATDLAVIQAMVSALEGSGHPIIISSGIAGITQGRPATEQDVGDPARLGRMRSETEVLAAAGSGVRPMVMRYPPTVHGAGDHGFVAELVRVARERGASAYIGDGENRWAATHRLDVAHVLRLALESGQAGARYHAVAEEGIPTRQIAEVIGRHLNVPVVSKTPDEAGAHFGWIGRFFGMDLQASSTWTREQLDWQPTHQGLIADLEEGHYFTA